MNREDWLEWIQQVEKPYYPVEGYTIPLEVIKSFHPCAGGLKRLRRRIREGRIPVPMTVHDIAKHMTRDDAMWVVDVVCPHKTWQSIHYAFSLLCNRVWYALGIGADPADMEGRETALRLFHKANSGTELRDKIYNAYQLAVSLYYDDSLYWAWFNFMSLGAPMDEVWNRIVAPHFSNMKS